MNASIHLEGTAARLGAPSAVFDGEKVMVLAAVRAGAELARHLPDGDPVTRLKGTLSRWCALLTDGADQRVQGLLDGTGPQRDAAWLREALAHRLAVEPELPLTLLMGLLVLLPPGYSHLRDAHAYIASAADALLWGDELPRLLAWLERANDGEDVQRLDEFAAQWRALPPLSGAFVATVVEAHEAWKVEAHHRDHAGNFGFLRTQVLRALDALDGPAEELGAGSACRRDLRRYVEGDRFRVAVLGEFKRGKSSIINLLLGVDGLMPVDELPCTSAVTSLRYGDGFLFERQEANGQWERREAQEFTRAVSQAREVSRQGTNERVAHWRVTAPSPLLRTGFLEIVDTPGLGEDERRDKIALAEAQYADGALLILSAEQQVTLREAELAGLLRMRQENLLVIVNKADLSRMEAPRLIQYVHDRLEDRGVRLPLERIIAFSARLASGQARDSRSDLPSSAQLTELVRHRVLTQSAARKCRVMATKVANSSTTIRAEVDAALERWQRNLEDHEQHQAQRTEAATQRAGVMACITRAKGIIRDSSRATSALMDALYTALPALIEETQKHEAEWTSTYMPLTSPKKHAEQVAEKLKARFLRVIEEWMKGTGAAAVSQAVADSLEEAADELAPLRRYLQMTLGLSEKEAGERIARLEEASVRESVDIPVDTSDAAGVAFRVAVMTVITLVVGYVIADVVLYYLLSVISGFLNPILLVAAVVGGIVAYVFKGDDWVRAWIRSTMLEKIRDELVKDEARKKVTEAVRRGLAEYLDGLARSFEEHTRELLADVEFQNRRLEEQAQELSRRHGDPDWVRSELERLRARAKTVRDACDELERVHKALVESSRGDTLAHSAR